MQVGLIGIAGTGACVLATPSVPPILPWPGGATERR